MKQPKNKEAGIERAGRIDQHPEHVAAVQAHARASAAVAQLTAELAALHDTIDRNSHVSGWEAQQRAEAELLADRPGATLEGVLEALRRRRDEVARGLTAAWADEAAAQAALTATATRLSAAVSADCVSDVAKAYRTLTSALRAAVEAGESIDRLYAGLMSRGFALDALPGVDRAAHESATAAARTQLARLAPIAEELADRCDASLDDKVTEVRALHDLVLGHAVVAANETTVLSTREARRLARAGAVVAVDAEAAQ